MPRRAGSSAAAAATVLLGTDGGHTVVTVTQLTVGLLVTGRFIGFRLKRHKRQALPLPPKSPNSGSETLILYRVCDSLKNLKNPIVERKLGPVPGGQVL